MKKFSSGPFLSRRAVLRGAGGVGIALPLMEAMLPRRASAATAPRRLAILFMGNGVITKNWTPTGGETDFALTPNLEPLKDLRSKIVVLQGINNGAASASGGNGHNSGATCVLTGRTKVGSKTDGWGGGISIDQFIASRMSTIERDAGRRLPEFPSLQLGVASNAQHAGQPLAYISYAGTMKPLTNEDNPSKVFSRVFANVVADPTQQQAIVDRKKSILDAVKADFTQLSPRLGTGDRGKLEQHLNGIREIERRLALGGSGGTGTKPAEPPAGVSTDDNNLPQLSKLMIDMLVAAFATDRTRVATLQYTSAQSGANHSKWAGPMPSPGGHHGISHQTDGGSVDALTRITTWHMTQFAELGKRLQALTDADGKSMLDNTTVLITSEVSVGSTHSFRDMPFVLMGSCGGAFKTGRFLKFTGANSNDLFVSLANAMGVPDTTFGDAQFCKGPLAGLAG